MVLKVLQSCLVVLAISLSLLTIAMMLILANTVIHDALMKAAVY